MGPAAGFTMTTHLFSSTIFDTITTTIDRSQNHDNTYVTTGIDMAYYAIYNTVRHQNAWNDASHAVDNHGDISVYITFNNILARDQILLAGIAITDLLDQLDDVGGTCHEQTSCHEPIYCNNVVYACSGVTLMPSLITSDTYKTIIDSGICTTVFIRSNDFEQRDNSTLALIIVALMVIEVLLSDKLERLGCFKGHDLSNLCYKFADSATTLKWGDVITFSIMHNSGLFCDGSDVHQHDLLLAVVEHAADQVLSCHTSTNDAMATLTTHCEFWVGLSSTILSTNLYELFANKMDMVSFFDRGHIGIDDLVRVFAKTVNISNVGFLHASICIYGVIYLMADARFLHDYNLAVGPGVGPDETYSESEIDEAEDPECEVKDKIGPTACSEIVPRITPYAVIDEIVPAVDKDFKVTKDLQKEVAVIPACCCPQRNEPDEIDQLSFQHLQTASRLDKTSSEKIGPGVDPDEVGHGAQPDICPDIGPLVGLEDDLKLAASQFNTQSTVQRVSCFQKFELEHEDKTTLWPDINTFPSALNPNSSAMIQVGIKQLNSHAILRCVSDLKAYAPRVYDFEYSNAFDRLSAKFATLDILYDFIGSNGVSDTFNMIRFDLQHRRLCCCNFEFKPLISVGGVRCGDDDITFHNLNENKVCAYLSDYSTMTMGAKDNSDSQIQSNEIIISIFVFSERPPYLCGNSEITTCISSADSSKTIASTSMQETCVVDSNMVTAALIIANYELVLNNDISLFRRKWDKKKSDEKSGKYKLQYETHIASDRSQILDGTKDDFEFHNNDNWLHDKFSMDEGEVADTVGSKVGPVLGIKIGTNVAASKLDLEDGVEISPEICQDDICPSVGPGATITKCQIIMLNF